jgi:SAM-dependent methyltransferase
VDADAWDERYRAAELVWSAEPNRFVAEEVADLRPGRALDLACGEGRNAIWLAAQGWEVTGVDFSAVAIEKARLLAESRGADVQWVQADAVDGPDLGTFDLVVVAYLQLPAAERRRALAAAAGAVAPGGTLVFVAHDRSNLEAGWGGPKDPAVLPTADEVAADLAGLEIVKAGLVTREVETPEGPRRAIDVLVRARRP